VAHEWWGLNDDVRSLCERFAGEGFVALAPDLYHGEHTTDATRAAQLMQELETPKAMEDLAATVAALRAHPRCNGNVGIVGFCMGGAMSFAAAASVEGIRCAVPFYGIPVAPYWDAARLRVPIQAHFAKHDGWAKPERAAKMRDEVDARGGSMELFVYDANHAFMRAGDPAVYSAESAALAWPRAVGFLHAHLG
jgi:carboxymethylenebutenolidase